MNVNYECYIILYYILGMLGYTGKIFHTWILLGYIHKGHSPLRRQKGESQNVDGGKTRKTDFT